MRGESLSCGYFSMQLVLDTAVDRAPEAGTDWNNNRNALTPLTTEYGTNLMTQKLKTELETLDDWSNTLRKSKSIFFFMRKGNFLFLYKYSFPGQRLKFFYRD